MPSDQAAANPFPQDALDGLGDRLEQALSDVTAKMKELRAALAEQSQRAGVMEQHAAELERQLAIAEARLAVEMMHSAGLAAQASHMMAIAIEAGVPDLAEEGHAGEKSRLAQVYDAAFDAKAAELGIEDPARFREG